MSIYNYTISVNFLLGINTEKLHNEINSNSIILTSLQQILVKNDNVDIYFISALSGPEITELNNIISQHIPTFPKDINHQIINEKISFNNFENNKLISGNLSYDENLIFNSSEIEYLIENQYYKSPKTQITLDTADPTNSRIDVIYLNTSSTIDKLTGIAEPSPSAPIVSDSQFEILRLTIPASATIPNNIYKTTNWTPSETTSGLRINLTSTTDPYSAPNSIETTGILINDKLILNAPSTINVSNHSIFEFLFKSKKYWGDGKIRIIMYNNGSLNGTPVIIENGKYGLNSYEFNNYQRIMIDFKNFNLTNNFINKIEIEFLDNDLDFLIDDISIQGGLNLKTNRISKYQIENFSEGVIEEVKNELILKDIFPTTTKGDLVVDDGTVINRLGVGGDGQVLIGDSASSTGLNWLDFSLVNLNSVQVRRTTNFVVPGAVPNVYANIVFDETVIENDSSVIEHNNTNTDRIDIKKTDLYLIFYSAKAQDAQMQIYKNNTSVLTGSHRSVKAGSSHQVLISATLLTFLTVGDYIVLQGAETTTTAVDCIFADVNMTVIRLNGVKGDTGNPGDIEWKGAWISQNYVENEAVEYLGSAYVCKLDTTVNQDPTNNTYWDLIASKGDQGDQGIQGLNGLPGDIDWQGTWVSQNYQVHDAVEYLGSSYVCHTMTTSNQIPTDIAFWDLLAQQGATGASGDIEWTGEWNNSTTYNTNQATFYQGSSYVATGTNLNDPPPSANWNIIASKGDTGIISTIQLRKSTFQDNTLGTFINQVFDVKDLETNSLEIEQNVGNPERVDIKYASTYLVSYTASVFDKATIKIVKNDITDIPGSERTVDAGSSHIINASATVVVNLLLGDYLTIKVLVAEGDKVKENLMFTVTKIEGIPGPKGADGDVVWKGVWDNITVYSPNDAVEKDGTSYIANITNSGDPPPSVNWDIMASIGDTGIQGVQGIPGIPGDIVWQGTWISQNYVINDTVHYLGGAYVCIQNTVSNEIPTNATYWDIVAEGGGIGPSGDIDWKNGWDSGTTYVINDAVTHLGNSYLCITNNLNDEPPSGNWDILAKGADFNWKGVWDNVTNYIISDVVERNGSSYRANAPNLNDSPPSANWGLVAQQGLTGAPGDIEWKGTWNEIDTYLVNYAIERAGSTYVALSTNTNDPPPSLNWDLISQKGNNIGFLTQNSIATTFTTSTIYIPMNSMTITNASVGTYMVTFSATGNGNTSDQQQDIGIFVASSLISDSHRTINYDLNTSAKETRMTLHSQAVVTVNGFETIEVKYKTNTGTFTVYERSIVLLQLI